MQHLRNTRLKFSLLSPCSVGPISITGARGRYDEAVVTGDAIWAFPLCGLGEEKCVCVGGRGEGGGGGDLEATVDDAG